MSSKQGRVDRAVDRIMGLDGPGYGDERERAVVMEAGTWGMTVGIVASIGAALVAAVLGLLLAPVLLLVLSAVPAFATIGYAQRRGVDLNELNDRSPLSEKAWVFAVVFGGLALVVGAMAYTVFTGHGLVQLPDLELIGPDASGVGASMVRGAAMGGFGGLLVGMVAMLVGPRLRARRAAKAPAELPDED